MIIEAEYLGPRHLSGFKGIPVYWGSGLEGCHCIDFVMTKYTWKNSMCLKLNSLFDSEMKVYYVTQVLK